MITVQDTQSSVVAAALGILQRMATGDDESSKMLRYHIEHSHALKEAVVAGRIVDETSAQTIVMETFLGAGKINEAFPPAALSGMTRTASLLGDMNMADIVKASKNKAACRRMLIDMSHDVGVDLEDVAVILRDREGFYTLLCFNERYASKASGSQTYRQLLLRPNGRPVQTHRDLEALWTRYEFTRNIIAVALLDELNDVEYVYENL